VHWDFLAHSRTTLIQFARVVPLATATLTGPERYIKEVEFRSCCLPCRKQPTSMTSCANPPSALPAEKLFRKRYTKAPSFFTMHLGIKAGVLPPDCDCHHIIVEVRLDIVP
jgi:hypothetical protein